ncbi:hypothetical protein [Streptomyces sp. NBC_00154]|uniref:hypothetical protein n=1 Tax=Streptomyces sp. NBC_00154 TaxID=2975670 RepID=UPI002253019D|nr:hypothetical protein [Streptomyces sp. NBC_00154]MCX5315706.1 hypothetical protein [Streptomyces sp. NBC_00154]
MLNEATAAWCNVIISGALRERAHQALGDHSTVAAWAQKAAKNADGAAYADAVPEYAALEWDGAGAVAR